MMYADAHADTFYRMTLEGLDIMDEHAGLHVNLPRMRAVGQCLQVCSVFTPKHYSGEPAEQFARRIIETLDTTSQTHPDDFLRVRTKADITLLGGQRVGLMPWLEGASPLRGDLGLLDEFFALGVRGIGLTHNHANEVADGCGVPDPRSGLSDFGRDLVQRMEELGVAVDCAHLPQPAFGEVMDLITRPPIITHVGCRRFVDITRNVTDDQLRAISNRGGFVGIDFYAGHILEGAFEEGVRDATCDDLADHVLHAIDVCGEDHVGFGGDFDGFNDTFADLHHVGEIGNVASALERKGLTLRVIEKLLADNLLAYLSQTLPS